MSRVIITGATGGAANRLEISDFVKDEKFFSLYVQALQRMYTSTTQSDFQSFFQVGGIHGLPNTPWDGAVGSKPWNPNTQWGGYCTHGSVLFPTWHRPYVMLYEQILQKHAVDIAATYTVNQDSWKTAAANLRQPYWDWAANAVPPAEVISLTKVTITGPNGTRISVDNPLYHYRFHPIDPSFYRPFNQWQTTLRQPNSTRPTATDNVSRLRSVLSSAQEDITMSTYSMLTRVHTWSAFSSHTVGDGGSSSNSLEAVHDGIHVSVGGNGHMSDPAVAAFDPIFFLHHCNVDRMLSLWSALNPGVWVAKGDSQDGSFTMAAEIPVDATTPLTPFWNAQDSFWISSTTQATTKLGYTYPEFNGLDMGNTDAVKTAIGNIVNRLYGSAVFGTFATASAPESETATSSSVSAGIAAFAAPVQFAASLPHVGSAEKKAADEKPLTPPTFHWKHKSDSSEGHSNNPGHSILPPNQGMHDWAARIHFKKYELGTSFSVLIFLGAVPENTDDWLVSPNFVGAHHAFVNSNAGACENCRNQSNVVGEGFVHLNRAIVRLSGLQSLDPDAVVPYLTKELNWRVLKSNGEHAELSSLEVCVLGAPLTYPPGAMFPVAGTPHLYGSITHGRSGGSHSA